MRALRHAVVTVVASLLVAACGGAPPPSASEPLAPTTAEATPAPRPGKRWTGWRYTGDREQCFFIVGRKCFADQASACAAAACGDKHCETDGAGPATVSCH